MIEGTLNAHGGGSIAAGSSVQLDLEIPATQPVGSIVVGSMIAIDATPAMDSPNQESGLVTAVQSSGGNVVGFTVLSLANAHSAGINYWVVSRQSDSPRPDLILPAVRDISLVNTGAVTFKGSCLYEFPDPSDWIDLWPWLVVMIPQHYSWAFGGEPRGERASRNAMNTEPIWDLECFAIWPHSLDNTHYTDVVAAEAAMTQTWINHSDLGPNVPTVDVIEVHGFKRSFMSFESRVQLDYIALSWVVSVHENLRIIQTP